MKSNSSNIDWVIRIVCSLFLIPIIIFIYCYFFGQIPQTTGTTYAGALTLYDDDKPLEDSTVILEANLYTNEQKNGQKLFELLFTTYKGTDTSNIYGKGMQAYYEPHIQSLKMVKEHSNGYSIFSTQKDWFYAMNIDNLYYYDLCVENDKKIAMSSPSPLSVDSGLVIDIGGTLAMLQFKADTALDSNFWKDSDILHMHIDDYYYIDPAYFFMTMYNSVISLEEGTHYVTVDLSDFFNVYLQDEDGQFNKLTATHEFTFVTCKINVHNEGVTSTKQSMFGAFASQDAKEEIQNEPTSNFWNVENNYSLTINDFDNIGGYLKVKNDIVQMLSKFDRIRCNITIDLVNSQDIKGLAVYGLYGIKVNQIYIKGAGNFIIMDNALKETNVRKILIDKDIVLDSIEDLPCEMEVLQ